MSQGKASTIGNPGWCFIDLPAMQFTADFKLGHYMKIPPRPMFCGQVRIIECDEHADRILPNHQGCRHHHCWYSAARGAVMVSQIIQPLSLD
jgi:hypothetical protein